MKKIMMGTAIGLVAMSGSAMAQEWSIGLGGVFTGGIGYIDTPALNNSSKTNDVGIYRDSEFQVRPRLVADNGLTFGVDMEFDVDSDTQNMDENSAFVSGSFGRVEIGEQDGMADRFQNDGIVAPPFASATDGVGMLFDVYSGRPNVPGFDVNGGDTSDDLKISYLTPNFSGFEAGISFIPSVGKRTVAGSSMKSDKGRASNLENGTNAVEIGAGYANTFGELSFSAGIGYTSDTAADSKDDSSIGGGAKIGYGGFEFGASYGWYEGTTDDGAQFGVGVSYATGPWSFGVDYAQILDTRDAPNAGNAMGIGAGVGYALAPGVQVGLGLEYLDPDTAANSSFAAATYMGINF